MRRLMLVKSWLWSLVPVLFLLGLWALLWGSLGAPDYGRTLNPTDLSDFLYRGLRATFPLFAGGMATMIIAVKLPRRPDRSLFFSPLGLAALYGLVGLAAAFLSPNGSVSLYWALAYLSVPLVIFAAVWGDDPLDQIARLIRLNWLIVVLFIAAFFTMSLLYLGVWNNILHPESLFQCWPARTWFDLTSGFLRETGVGRFAGIAAIIAISGLWWRQWRILWGLVLLASLILLLHSGARTAMVGFAFGAPFVILLHGGKRAVVVSAIILAILAPLAWGMGIPETFFRGCISRGYTAGTSLLAPPVHASTQEGSGEQASPQENPVATVLLTEQASAQENSDGLSVPPGAWVLQKVSSPEDIPPDASGTLSVPPGTWVLERITSATPISTEESADIPPITSDPSAAPPAPVPTGAPSFPTAENDSGEPPAEFQIPPGSWVLKTQQNADFGASGKLEVSPGSWVLKPVPAISEGQESPAIPPATSIEPQSGLLPGGFYTLAGRTVVWKAALKTIEDSPLLGHGFHADRLLLGTHMHNSFLHAMIQTGGIGATSFIGAFLFGWILLVRALRNLGRLPLRHKHLVIQSAGVFLFLTLRTIPESGGAFFGVDLLLLGPILLYLGLVNRRRFSEAESR